MVEADDKLKRYLGSLNRSGYLFQLRVEEEIRNTYVQHEWEVEDREHYWQDPSTGEPGFVDILAKKGSRVLVIECKKSLGGTWIFPIASTSVPCTHAAICQVAGLNEKGSAVAGWTGMAIEPTSPQASFCIIRGSGEKQGESLLERWVQPLLNAVEHVAYEALDIDRKTGGRYPSSFVVIPTVVTTVELVVCRLRIGSIDLSTGQLDSIPQEQVQRVPYIRFSKSLSSQAIMDSPEPTRLRERGMQSERTVFLVQANHLVEFLRRFGVSPKTGGRWSG